MSHHFSHDNTRVDRVCCNTYMHTKIHRDVFSECRDKQTGSQKQWCSSCQQVKVLKGAGIFSCNALPS